MTAPKIKRREERVLMRVVRAGDLPPETGVLVPDSDIARARLREKGVRVGQVLSAVLKRARRPWYHRKAHLFGELVAQNIERFFGLDCHTTLKRLQLEANAGCDELIVDASSVWHDITEAIVAQSGENMRPAFAVIATFLAGVEIPVRVPRSLSFESMDEGEFRELMVRLVRHVQRTYWQSLTESEVDALTNLMPEAA